MTKKFVFLFMLVVLLVGISACQTGTAETAIPAYIPSVVETASPAIQSADTSSPIRLYFTDPAIKGQNTPGQTIIKDLITDINNAEKSIEVAMYNFTLKDVSDALIKAAQRGVAVRIVVDSDALQKLDLSRMKQAGIYAMGDRRESLMHNKFVVIDGRILWTGSLNLTSSGSENDENVMARIESKDLAANYEIKFNEMASEDKFGADSRSLTEKTHFDVNGIPVENYFSPEDKIDTRLVSLVGSAEKSVHVLAYSFTQDKLAYALIKAQKNGVEVRGVFDRASTEDNTGADFIAMQKAGLDMKLDGEPGLMHMKVIIVDGRTVVLGSYNFTASAENKNDENVLIITDPAVAAGFEKAFDRIYAKAD